LRQVKVAEGRREDAVLPLTFEAGFGGLDPLARREVFVNGLPQVQLPADDGTESVRVLVNVDDVALDILKQIVGETIRETRREGGKALPDGTLAVGLSLSQLFPSDLNVEIASANQLQRGGQVNEQHDVGAKLIWDRSLLGQQPKRRRSQEKHRDEW